MNVSYFKEKCYINIYYYYYNVIRNRIKIVVIKIVIKIIVVKISLPQLIKESLHACNITYQETVYMYVTLASVTLRYILS